MSIVCCKRCCIRTSDQHKIYDESNNRINEAANAVIGNHVWLGNPAVIMKGISIGDGCMIGMESMVTKNIESNTLAVGTPARVIKKYRWER